MGCHFLPQGIFPTQRLNPPPLHSPAVAGRFFVTSPRSDILRNSALFYVWEDERVWAHGNQPLDTHLNYVASVWPGQSFRPEPPQGALWAGGSCSGCWADEHRILSLLKCRRRSLSTPPTPQGHFLPFPAHTLRQALVCFLSQ